MKNTHYTKRTIKFIQYKALKTKNLLHEFYEETCWFLIQLQTYIQQLCLWLENFSRLRRTVFIKPGINRYDFKWTDFVLDRIKQKQKQVQGWEDKHKRVLILVHSPIATSSSPYSKVESTKIDTHNYSIHNNSWTVQELQQTLLKNTILAYLALQETLSRVTNTYTYYKNE